VQLKWPTFSQLGPNTTLDLIVTHAITRSDPLKTQSSRDGTRYAFTYLGDFVPLGIGGRPGESMMNLILRKHLLFRGLERLLNAKTKFHDTQAKFSQIANGDDDLRAAFESHRSETALNISRLRKCCELLKGSKRPIQDDSAAQSAIQDEIATYQSCIDWATQLDYRDIADLLTMSLEDERRIADRLYKISEQLTSAY